MPAGSRPDAVHPPGLAPLRQVHDAQHFCQLLVGLRDFPTGLLIPLTRPVAKSQCSPQLWHIPMSGAINGQTATCFMLTPTTLWPFNGRQHSAWAFIPALTTLDCFLMLGTSGVLHSSIWYCFGAILPTVEAARLAAHSVLADRGNALFIKLLTACLAAKTSSWPAMATFMPDKSMCLQRASILQKFCGFSSLSRCLFIIENVPMIATD